ncbi:MAG TPA: hypothetical protein VIU37_00185, partial [Candidatus Limnocylindrales bacterium]
GVGDSIIIDGSPSEADLAELETRTAAFLRAVAEATGVAGDAATLAAAIRRRTEVALPAIRELAGRVDRAGLLGWLLLGRTGELAPAADVAATSRAWYEELRLAGALAGGLRAAALGEAEAWAGAELVRVLLALPRPSALRGPARTADLRLLDQWLAREAIRTAIGTNTWEGVEYIDRDAFDAMLRWAERLDAIDAVGSPAAAAGLAGAREPTQPGLAARLSAKAAAAGYRVDRLREALTPPAPARVPRRPRPPQSPGRRRPPPAS